MKKILEDLKNPKKKSLVMFGLYGIFFIFVFIIIFTGKTYDDTETYKDYINIKTSKIEEKNDNIVSNYEYIYKIIDRENITEITGTKTENKETFVINGKSYYKQDNNIYLNDGTNALVTDNLFNTDLYSYKNIEEFLKEKSTKEKTLYEDKTSKEIYSINSKVYFDYIKEDKCSNIDCSNIFIDIVVNKNSKEQIEKVNINLTNYYKYNYTIEINYNNINNIKEVSTN